MKNLCWVYIKRKVCLLLATHPNHFNTWYIIRNMNNTGKPTGRAPLHWVTTSATLWVLWRFGINYGDHVERKRKT
jgi:hypothetical protein